MLRAPGIQPGSLHVSPTLKTWRTSQRAHTSATGAVGYSCITWP